MSDSAAEDRLLREAEKVERIANDVKRKMLECRRALAKASKQAGDADAASAAQDVADQLGALTSGLEAVNRAITEKYLDNALSTPASYAKTQLETSIIASRKVAAEARAIAPKATAAATASSSSSFASATRTLRNVKSSSPPPADDDAERGSAPTASAPALAGAVMISGEQVDRESATEMRELASEAREIRLLQEHLNQLAHEQAALLETAESNIDGAGKKIERGRKELSTAAKYKFTAMTMTGALVGGLIAGPVGMLAGAKSVATVMACAAAGTATGAIATKQVTNIVKSNLDQQQRDLLTAGPARAAISE